MQPQGNNVYGTQSGFINNNDKNISGQKQNDINDENRQPLQMQQMKPNSSKNKKNESSNNERQAISEERNSFNSKGAKLNNLDFQ